MITSASLKESGVEYVEAKFLDLNGILRSRTFPVERYDAIKDGYGFDGSSVGFVDISDSDMVAKPIEETCRIMSCDGFKTAIFLCDLYKDDKPFDFSGRNILKNLLKTIPYTVFKGPEIEFYLTKNGRPLDEATYMCSNPNDMGESFKKQFMKELNKSNSGLSIHVAHHEVGHSQHEFELQYDEPVKMIDNTILFKINLRNFAKKEDLEVSYMPKPFLGRAGNGMHYHISLWKDGEPLFFKDDNELSDVGKNFIAGILEFSQEILLMTNGTVNSYKRLVLGHEAPVYVVWGHSNRSALIRIPKYKKFEPKTARIEVRTVDALNDHYLAFAALIKAGMIGIKKELEPPKRYQSSTYNLKRDECKKLGIKVLPRNLNEAIEEAKNGTILKELLGPLFDRFIKLKQDEWHDYTIFLDKKGMSHDTEEVTEWEVKRYFNM